MASPTNDLRIVVRLFKKVIFPAFGVQGTYLVINKTYFIKRKIEALWKKYETYHKYGFGYHP